MKVTLLELNRKEEKIYGTLVDTEKVLAKMITAYVPKFIWIDT
jgi:hypothetical protein